MYVKINSEEFLGVAELKRLQRSFTDDGIIRNLLANTRTFGLVKDAILNGTLIEAKDVFLVEKAGSPAGDIIINPGSAIDKFGLFSILDNSLNISISPDSQFYWVKIAHTYTPNEVGKVSVDVDGNLTGIGTKFTEVFRGQPDFPSKIRFTNAVTNVFNYEVVKVIDDFNAILAGDFAVETNLDYCIYGTFTPGFPVPFLQNDIFQYDSVSISLIPESSFNTEPAKVQDEEFYIARVSFDGVTLLLEDKRGEFWQTHATYDIRTLDRLFLNNLLGVEKILWDIESSPKNANYVDVAWTFRSSSYTIDTSSNKITILAGSGGRFKDTTYFSNGQFDGWKIYAKNGTFKTIIDSQKTGSQIILTLDNLEPNDYTGFTRILLAPPFEAIEIKATCDNFPVDIERVLEMNYEFPINEEFGRICLRVPRDGYKYNLTYRYRTFEGYTDWQIFLDDAVGFYSETAFDDFGDLLPIVIANTIAANQAALYLKPYVASLTAGFIELFEHPDAYEIFAERVDTGDLFGVFTSALSPASFAPVLPLYVGTDRQYQHFLGAGFTLGANGFIELKKLRFDATPLRNGNFFILHINQVIVPAGFTLKIVEDFVNPTTYTLITELKNTDFPFLADTVGNPRGMTIRCTWNGTNWIADSVNETSTYDKVFVMLTRDAGFNTPGPSTLIPGLTYTTPNDGITRKLKISFKTIASLSFSPGREAIQGTLWVNAVRVDFSNYAVEQATSFISTVSGAVIVCMWMDDIPPNSLIEAHCAQDGTTPGGTVSFSKLLIEELK